MDEDHNRSLKQYVEIIKRLRTIPKKHRLRTMIWNDSCHCYKNPDAEVYARKSRDAEKLLPKDIVPVIWDYRYAYPSIVKRISAAGFKPWAAPGRTVPLVRNWKKALLQSGGEGLLLTCWKKCTKENRAELLNLVETSGPYL